MGKERSRKERLSLVGGVAGVIRRGIWVLCVHIVAGERILNQMDSK